MTKGRLGAIGVVLLASGSALAHPVPEEYSTAASVCAMDPSAGANYMVCRPNIGPNAYSTDISVNVFMEKTLFRNCVHNAIAGGTGARNNVSLNRWPPPPGGGERHRYSGVDPLREVGRVVLSGGSRNIRCFSESNVVPTWLSINYRREQYADLNPSGP